jgi:hypothetical protein
MLDLRSGRYPATASEVAITNWIADTLSIGIGSTLDLDGVPRTVVGVVENPSKLDDEFALLAPGNFANSESVTMFVDSSEQRAIDFRPPGDHSRELSSRSQVPEDVAATLFTLVVGGVAMFFVALVAAGQLRGHRPAADAPTRDAGRRRRQPEAGSADDVGQRRGRPA